MEVAMSTSRLEQQPIAITTTTLPQAAVQTVYLAVLAASGGVRPYHWTTSNALPAGLTLDGGGTISGIPVTPSAATVTFKVTDSQGTVATAPLSIQVTAPSPEPLAVATTSLPDVTTGVAYNTELEASGGTSPYQWKVTAGALPPNLSLDSSGIISGMTSEDSTTGVPLTVQVTDSSGSTATATFSINATAALHGPFLIQFIGAPLAGVCLQATFPGQGGAVTIAPIDTTGGTILQQWMYGSDQRLYLNAPGLTPPVCISFAPPAENHNPLLLASLAPADQTQQWNWSGQSNTSTFLNVGAPGFCFDVVDGGISPGTTVQIVQTIPNTNQAFALAFIPAFAKGQTS